MLRIFALCDLSSLSLFLYFVHDVFCHGEALKFLCVAHFLLYVFKLILIKNLYILDIAMCMF